MGGLDRQTNEAVVQRIVSGAGGNQADEFQPLRKIASLLCMAGCVCVILSGSALACGATPVAVSGHPDGASGFGPGGIIGAAITGIGGGQVERDITV